MSLYMIIDIEVKDAKIYQQYIQKAMPIIKKYGGNYLVRGGKVTAISSDWKPERIVIIEFPSQERFKQCFSCQEYKEIAPLRVSSTSSRTIIVEGLSESI